MTDVVDLLRELVSISSISRESNRGVISFDKPDGVFRNRPIRILRASRRSI
jgi:hypothetical protein